jgi:hypothetical protein
MNPLPGCGAFRLGYPFHLVEPRGRVAHVCGVLQRLLALLGKCKLGSGILSRAASLSFAIRPSRTYDAGGRRLVGWQLGKSKRIEGAIQLQAKRFHRQLVVGTIGQS